MLQISHGLTSRSATILCSFGGNRAHNLCMSPNSTATAPNGSSECNKWYRFDLIFGWLCLQSGERYAKQCRHYNVMYQMYFGWLCALALGVRRLFRLPARWGRSRERVRWTASAGRRGGRAGRGVGRLLPSARRAPTESPAGNQPRPIYPSNW